ncbi:MAG: hypothetical protein QNJ62_05120 [Methyloceanibacter sp.]|nr:hypothetical protein [Methyloceanibacter sp.]
MSKSNAFETDMLELYFNGTTHANLADNAGTSPATNLTVALHTADPGEAGNQSTNEISYTGYARVDVARTSGGWTITGDSVSPNANIVFGEKTGGANATATHFSVGTGTSNYMMYSGTITPNISVVDGVVPTLTTASTIQED